MMWLIFKELILLFLNKRMLFVYKRISGGASSDFGLVIVYCPGKQFFSHVGTEPLLPGYLPVLWRA